MKTSFFTQSFVLCVLLLVSCSTQTTEPAGSSQDRDEQIAQQTLVTFLENLHRRQYEQAARLYGGPYESMIDNNPSIDPGDHAALMKNACEINGIKCLEVDNIVLDSDISSKEYNFRVKFLNDDGTLFVRGPCCGGSATDYPPESSFILTVVKDNEGKFVVMHMPPYVP